MEVVSYLYGGGPHIKRYQAGTTITTRGIPLLGAVDAGTDLGSVEPSTASTPVNTGSQVGIGLDLTGTVAATGATTADIMVTVEVRPDAIIRAKMSGGTASDTALATTTATSADTTGATVTGSTTYDNGAVWGYTGANVGEYRRADDTAGSMAISFPNGILTTDTYIAVHGFPCGVELTAVETHDLTATLDQLVAQTAITDKNEFVIYDIEPNAADNDGINNSYFHLIQNNHLFCSSSLA